MDHAILVDFLGLEFASRKDNRDSKVRVGGIVL